MANAVTTTKQAVDAGLKVKKVMDKLTEAEKLIKTASQMQSVASPWIKVIGMLGRTYWMKDGTKTATASQEERVAAVKRCSPAAALDVQLGRVAAELSRKAYLPKVTNEALGCLEDVGPLSVIKFQEQRVEKVVDEDGKTLFTIRRPQWFLAVGHKKSLQRTGGEEDLDPTLFLVYRGTQTADDLRVDTYVGPATFGDSEEFFHSGFLSAAVNDVSLKLAFEKAKEAKEVSPETTLVVCGHSLGGAIAMTWELAGLREEYAPWHTGEVQVVSIGGPATMWAKPGPESLVELSSERAIQERMHLVRKARLQSEQLSSERAIQERMHLVRKARLRSEQSVELRSRKAKLLLVVNELDIVPRMLGSPEHIYEDLLKTVEGAVKMPVQVAAGAMAAFLGPLAATVSKSVVDQMCDAYAGQLVSQYVGIYANYTHHPEAKVLYICDGQIFEIPRTNADAWIEATQIHSYKGLAYARKYYRSIQEYHSATMYQHGLEGVWRPKQLRAIAGDVPDGTVRVMCMRHSRSYGDYVNERYLSEDPKLDHVGRWEAERESRFLKESGLLDDPEALIVVSPYRNALQTILFLAGSSEKLKELTGAGRLLVQPLAGERQHKTDWARGWSKDWLENGMARSFWNAVEGRFYAVSPEDHLNRLPDGGGAVRDDVKFKGGELDFGPLDDYCKKMGPRWAKSGAWWEHGHDRGYETRDEWLERADRLCAWLHDEAKRLKKRKVLLISHNEILIDAFYRDRDSYGTAPAEGQLERQIVDFRHVEARCFDLMHEQAGKACCYQSSALDQPQAQ